MKPKTKSVRIALLFEYATLNGGERSMLACLDWLQRQQTDVEFVAIAPGRGRLAEALASRGIRVIPWTAAHRDPIVSTHDDQQSALNDQASLLEAVRLAEPTLLHANSLAMGRLTGRLAAQRSGPMAIPTTAHLRDILNLSRAAMSDLNCNQRLIAVSRATRDMHVARGLDASRTVVVRNGLDLELFQPRPATGWLHRELQLPSQSILIGTIGQIGLRKGQDTLAAAAPEIVRRNPDARFLLIGERSSTKAESIAFEQSIEQRFAEQGLASCLHRLGYRDDIPALMTELSLIVHPANQEPFGRVLLEAAACGIPVVATNVGGTPEIIVDGVTGRLVPSRDPAALATAVTELLQDTGQLRSMSVAARERAVGEFSIARAAGQLLEQWRAVIASAVDDSAANAASASAPTPA